MHKKAISLGKQIVNELGREPGADILSRWMAHYIAERIEIAETASGTAKAKAEAKCFQTILELWKHRRVMPDGRRLFENFEPVLNALIRLDPDNSKPYFHRVIESTAKRQRTIESDTVQKLIDSIFHIDKAARVLIEEVLTEISERTLNARTKAMLKSSLPPRSAKDIVAINFLVEKALHKQSGAGDEQQAYDKLIRERLEILNFFSRSVNMLRKVLQNKIANSKIKNERSK